jgi:hypothetical protein
MAQTQVDLIPIEPSRGVYLQPYRGSFTGIEVDRLAELFRETLAGIAADDREVIHGHWDSARIPTDPPGMIPYIHLDDELMRQHHRHARPWSHGMEFVLFPGLVHLSGDCITWEFAWMLACARRWATSEKAEYVALLDRRAIAIGDYSDYDELLIRLEQPHVEALMRGWGMSTTQPPLMPRERR